MPRVRAPDGPPGRRRSWKKLKITNQQAAPRSECSTWMCSQGGRAQPSPPGIQGTRRRSTSFLPSKYRDKRTHSARWWEVGGSQRCPRHPRSAQKVISTPHATLLTSALPIMRKKSDRRVRAGIRVDRLVGRKDLNARLGRELVHLCEPSKDCLGKRNGTDLTSGRARLRTGINLHARSCSTDLCSENRDAPSPRSKTTRHFMTVPGRQSGAEFVRKSCWIVWVPTSQLLIVDALRNGSQCGTDAATMVLDHALKIEVAMLQTNVRGTPCRSIWP